MSLFFTLFLIDDKSDCPLKQNEKCLLKGTQLMIQTPTRVSDTQNKTIEYLEIGDVYTLPSDGWLISPYTTYHEEHIYYVRHFKGNLAYELTCFYIELATERLHTMNPQKEVERAAKKRWLRLSHEMKWVDSVLNDWLVEYSM